MLTGPVCMFGLHPVPLLPLACPWWGGNRGCTIKGACTGWLRNRGRQPFGRAAGSHSGNVSGSPWFYCLTAGNPRHFGASICDMEKHTAFFCPAKGKSRTAGRAANVPGTGADRSAVLQHSVLATPTTASATHKHAVIATICTPYPPFPNLAAVLHLCICARLSVRANVHQHGAGPGLYRYAAAQHGALSQQVLVQPPGNVRLQRAV